MITAGFLHGGVLHILMNSWVMFDLGFRVEELFGTARFLVIYLVSSACGFVASTFWTPYLSIGASAGIFGLIGALIADGYRGGSSIMASMYLRWALIILVVGLLPFFPFDNAAHLGGLAAGFFDRLFRRHAEDLPPDRISLEGRRGRGARRGRSILLSRLRVAVGENALLSGHGGFSPNRAAGVSLRAHAP